MKKVFSLILALALMLGLFPQISLQAAAADSTIALRYDDHVDMTGKAVQIMDAGQGPVIALEGNHLVATSIGSAQVRIDGTAYTVTVDRAKLNLIMIMGQSNAGNHFENATSDVTCPVGTAYWWGNGLGTAATEPVPYTQPSMGFHTPLLAELYAQSLAAGDPVKNVMIWHEDITSKDGQSITKWASSAADTSGTDDAVTMLENCRSYYQRYSDRYEIVSSGVYWLQGESDLTMDPTQYTQLFMAMWQRLKAAGMEYLAFFRVRREIHTNSPIWDDLFYSASLSAQIQMINDNPEFYMATTLTENWIGAADDLLTVDISKYITVMQAYGKQASYSDAYGNTAAYADGKLTTTMRSLYGSNNYCHYGKFGYGLIGADAAYNMYRALHGEKLAFVVTDTSGYASRAQVLTNGQSLALDISNMTDNLSFRGDCGSTGGTLKFAVRSSVTDITAQSGVVVSSGEKYGSVSTSVLRGYPDVSILLTYTTADGDVHTAICHLQNGAVEPQKDYIWDFNEDLNARGDDGEILNSFLEDALAGSYKIENGYLTASGLQLALENTIELHATRNWSIEWKYGALNGGTAGFLLSQDKGNTIGNKALWHVAQGNPVIADYLDSEGYRNYTCDDIVLKDHDRVKLTNSYDPISGKSTVSLWLNGERMVADLGQKGSLNGYDDDRDMSDYPLIADFAFRYLGNRALTDWRVNCQLDYLKISFGETQPEPVEETYYLVGFINGANYGCEEDYENMGQYLFENGQLTAAFTSDSYVFLKTGNNGRWLMSDAYCEDRTCTFVEDGSEKMKVPAYVTVTFTLVENEDGSVTLSYVTSADQCSHSYTSQVTTAATCTASGVRTCICSECGHRYTESIPAAGHSYTSKVTTAPTCTTAGVRTYTCSKCGDSYTESIAATGHNYYGGFCTVCGAADPSVPATYYLFGYINDANYGCEEDYENMGIYQFVDGKLTATFTTDSYVGVKTEGNGRWFMTDGWQGTTVTGATLYDTGSLFAADKLYVPGGVQVTFTLRENADGTLTLSYVTDSGSPSIVPTISLKYPSLSFEDVIIMNVYYTAADMQDVVEMGLITNTVKPATVSIENADRVIPGYGVEGSYCFSSTAGIAPKDIGDTIYFAVYAKLKDGKCTYTKMIGYSPRTYAMNQLSTGSADMRPLVAAMLNYGAAAQSYFDYKTDTLMNADMTAAQKALVASYSSSMIANVTQVSGSKVGSFVNDSSYTKRYPTISFEGAFCINYYFQPSLTVKGDVTMYLWTLEDFNKASVLTKGNATKAVKMTLTDSGEYLGVVDGIAAKDLDKAVYVSFVYSDGTTEHCGGVIGYTIGLYCKSQAAKTGTLAELSKACAVYGYYAKQLFQ